MNYLRENLEEADYVSAEAVGDDGEYVLTDIDGKRELWFASPHFAGYAVVLEDGTELEFARSL